MPNTIAAGEFKAKCLKLMDEIVQTKETLVVTKHGKPVVYVMPVPPEEPEKKELFGSMRGSGVILGDIISPIDVEWDAMK